MASTDERLLAGLERLAAVTTLLQRIRLAHPTAGLYEAADLQWSWRKPRSTDGILQPLWYDRDGRPEAAVVATDWGDRVALDPMVQPGLPPERIVGTMERGLVLAQASGFATVGLEVDPADVVLPAVLAAHGFRVSGRGYVESWLPAEARPPVSALATGYRLMGRDERAAAAYHLVARNGVAVEERLRQTSLYRPDLDLAVLDPTGEVAAYGLFWFDPVSRTGLVEPMRTEDAHQRRGLARHILTAGIDRLAAAGATRIKICFEPDNVAARDLYLHAGFRPHRETITYSR
ncbi:MAG: GNAT family N-acetyltransferase [Anaerolineae bacterium]